MKKVYRLAHLLALVALLFTPQRDCIVISYAEYSTEVGIVFWFQFERTQPNAPDVWFLFDIYACQRIAGLGMLETTFVYTIAAGIVLGHVPFTFFQIVGFPAVMWVRIPEDDIDIVVWIWFEGFS
jgi:hypothetical protein